MEQPVKHALERYRETHRLSRPALGVLLGVSGPTIHRWESGARNIDIDILPRVAELTGIPARELRPDLARLFEEAGP